MVSLTYGNDAQKMLWDLVAGSGVLEKLRPADTVMIKPNLVVSRRAWAGVNTDPRVVEALVKVLKDAGATRIVVGDGSGMGYSATKAFQVCRYTDLAKRYGLRLVDLERDRFVSRKVPIDGPFKELQIAQTVLDCDFLVNMPVMKAHSMTLITCSLKNLKGVMPRRMKTAFHGVDLSRAIAQLASVISPDLIVVDGLQGDLSSETGRTPVAMEMLLLGTNPVEVDSVVADILGYVPRSIRHISHSADAGLGNCNLDQIKIHPLNRPQKNQRFVPPLHYSKRFPCHISAERACCTCMGNLIFALERLHEKGLLSNRQSFLVGRMPEPQPAKAKTTIAVGQCASNTLADVRINKCPPTAGTIYRRVLSVIQD